MKKFLALCTSALLGLGLSLGGATMASATTPDGSTEGTNQEDYWEQVAGEVCVDVGYSTENSVTNPYSLPGQSSGYAYSKVIVKAGSTGQGGVVNENEVFTSGLVQGATFVHPDKVSISHVIVCWIVPPPSGDRQTVTENPDCETKTVEITTTTYTTSYTWSDLNDSWVAGAEGAGVVVVTQRDMTDAEKQQCAGEKPEPLTRDDKVEQIDCIADEVEITTTTYTTEYVWDGDNWVLGTEVAGTPVISFRELTDEEKRECPPGQPEPQQRVVVANDYDCVDEQVTVTTTTYETPYVWDPVTEEWILGAESEGVEVVTQRDKTQEEIEECLLTFPLDTDPEFSTCAAGDDERTELTTWIRVDFVENVQYRIDGVVVTSEFTEVTEGPHEVTAEGINGYTLDPSAEIVWNYDVENSANCDLITRGQFEAGASATSPSCVNPSGFLSFHRLPDEVGFVEYFVDGISVGTTVTKLNKAPGNYVVTAAAVNPLDTVTNPGPWNLTVVAFTGECLPTLALTGASTEQPLQLAGGMVMLGLLGLYLRRRMVLTAAK